MSGTPSSPRIALVLGAGGIKCISSIGLLKVLHREQLIPDLIVGSSGGSLFGAVYAFGEHPEEIETLVLKMWQKQEFADIKYFDILRMFFPKLLGYNESFGLIRGNRVEKIFREYFQGATFDNLKIPLQIVATDLFTGESVVLNDGLVAEAVRASISIPIFFQPKKIGRHVLVDGAVSDPLPIDVAIRHGADIIIAMGYENPTYTAFDSPIATLLHLTALYNNNLLVANHSVHTMAHHYEIITICPDLPQNTRFFDIEKIPELIRIGEEAMLQDMPNIRSAIENFR